MGNTHALMAGLRGLVLLACVAATSAQVLYAGFDHILSVDKNGNVTAFDYRRKLTANSTCDIVAMPPLVKEAALDDWILDGISKVASPKKPLQYTYLGYELYMTEQKDVGAYIIRRCRDFRPQLTELPCEAFSTGLSDMFRAPKKTVFLGNNRVMIVDTTFGDFTVHPFDADVHSGGDPFKFEMGPLFSGKLPITVGLEKAKFAHVKVDGETDILLIQAGDGRTTGFKYNGIALSADEFLLKPVLKMNTAWNTTITTLGENRVLSYAPNLDYEVRQIYLNGSDYKAALLNTGNLGGGVDCMADTAPSCVKRKGCAWCPSTYTCHNYDQKSNIFCDRHQCGAPPILEETLGENPLSMVVVPDCSNDPAMEHANIIDTLDEGYDKLLPGNKRLPDTYRASDGEHANAEASPIHPVLDNELGDEPIEIEDEQVDQLILTKNKVSQGQVYTPPPVGSGNPCMDADYTPFKGADAAMPVATGQMKMNHPSTYDGEQADILTQSPMGEANATQRKIDCARYRAQLGMAAPADNEFHPKEPTKENMTKPERYRPDNGGTFAEEGIMNFDERYGDLAAQWIDPSLNPTRGDSFPTSSPLVPGKGELEYKPKEPQVQMKPKMKPFARPPQPLRKSTEELMEAGVKNSEGKFGGADCSETGGEDGIASVPMTNTMANIVTPVMPKSLEQQLGLFADEEKKIVDWMPAAEPDTQLGKVTIGVTLPQQEPWVSDVGKSKGPPML